MLEQCASNVQTLFNIILIFNHQPMFSQLSANVHPLQCSADVQPMFSKCSANVVQPVLSRLSANAQPMFSRCSANLLFSQCSADLQPTRSQCSVDVKPMLAKVQPLIFERVANVLPGTADFNEDLLTSLLRQPHWPQLYRSIFSEGLSLDGADHACCRFVAIVEPPISRDAASHASQAKHAVITLYIGLAAAQCCSRVQFRDLSLLNGPSQECVPVHYLITFIVCRQSVCQPIDVQRALCLATA